MIKDRKGERDRERAGGKEKKIREMKKQDRGEERWKIEPDRGKKKYRRKER